MFIHEEKNGFITEEETNRLFRAATNPANEMLEINGVEHSQAFQQYPDEYLERIDTFLRKNSEG